MRHATIRTKFGCELAKRGLSQTEFSKCLGVPVTRINNYCVNGIKTVRIAERYAAVLHCRPEELMEFTPRSGAAQ